MGHPSENDSIKSQISSKTSRGTAQKDTINDITSDSQVNSKFPYRWSNTQQLYLPISKFIFITRITINNNISHLKSAKNQNRRTALGLPAIKLLGVGGGGGGGGSLN